MMLKAKNIFQQIANNKLALIFTLLVLSEFVYKICVKEYFHSFKISAGLKILLQLFFIVKIIQQEIKKLWPVVLLVIVFALGQVGLVPWSQFQNNAWFLDKYLFILLTLLFVNSIKDVEKLYPFFFKVFEVFIIVNSILIVFAFVVPTDYFNTYYGNNKRFGFNGLIMRSGAGTYIYWIALFYYATECFVLNKKKIIPLVIVFLTSLLLGTKAIFLAIMFIALLIWTTYNGHKNKWHWVGITVATVVAIVYFKDGLVWVLSKSDSLNVVYQERGWFSAMVSLRDQHLLEELLPLVQEKWTWRNYLFGGGYDMHFRSQFGVLDLLYFFGIIGSVVYLLIFSKLFVTFRLNKITAIFLVGTFILMAFSANFFYETIMAFYLVLIKGYFESNFKKEKVT